MKRFVLAGDDYPVIIHTCNNARQQRYLYKKRLESGAWKRVEMVTGDYSFPDLNTWEICDEKK